MANFEINGMDELMKALENIGDMGETASKMLNEAAPVVTREMKKELSQHKETGDMESSIKETKAKQKKSGNGQYVLIRPTGKGKNGTRNMEKLAFLQYGTGKQVPRPVMEKIMNRSGREVKEVMEEVFKREVSKKWT